MFVPRPVPSSVRKKSACPEASFLYRNTIMNVEQEIQVISYQKTQIAIALQLPACPLRLTRLQIASLWGVARPSLATSLSRGRATPGSRWGQLAAAIDSAKGQHTVPADVVARALWIESAERLQASEASEHGCPAPATLAAAAASASLEQAFGVRKPKPGRPAGNKSKKHRCKG